MKIISFTAIFIAVLIVTVLSTNSAVSAMNTGSLKMHSESSPVVVIVNKDQFEGNWKQFKGDLKKQWGKLTDDDLLIIEGNYEKFEGRVQERYGDKKEEVKRWTDEWFKKHHPVRSEKNDK
jgi:uncharacterized protein YjbJ (UPF0337 family)